MRTLAVGAIAGLIALFVASMASAAPTASMVWTGTTGGGSTGGSSITAAVGDTLTLDVLIMTGESGAGTGVTAVGISLDFGTAGTVTLTNVGGGVNDNDGTTVTNYSVAASATLTGGPLVLVSATTCPGSATGNLAAGLCGMSPFLLPNASFPPIDNGDGTVGPFVTLSGGPVPIQFTIGRAVFEVVPEPATGGLLALGLGGLAFIGRRRA